MKQAKFTWIAGTALGLALVIGGCEKKSQDISPPATSQAPAPEKSMPDQPSTSQGPSGPADPGATGSAQGQKPDEAKNAPKG